MSAAAAAADEIYRVIRNQLDDCERAIKGDDKNRALRELDDAIRQLSHLVDDVRRLDD